MNLIFVFKLKIFDETVFLVVTTLTGAEVPPEAADEVSYDYCNNDKSEYFINIKHHVLRNDLFVS